MLRRARSLVKGRLPAARRSYSSGDESARRPQLDTEVFERFPPRQDVVVSAIDNRTIEQTRKLPPVSMARQAHILFLPCKKGRLSDRSSDNRAYDSALDAQRRPVSRGRKRAGDECHEGCNLVCGCEAPEERTGTNSFEKLLLATGGLQSSRSPRRACRLVVSPWSPPN